MPDNIEASVNKSKSVAIGDGAQAVHQDDQSLLVEIHSNTRDTRDRVIELEVGQKAINENMQKIIDNIIERLARLESSDKWQWFVIAVLGLGLLAFFFLAFYLGG